MVCRQGRLYVRKNPLLVVRMVVLFLFCFFMSPSRRSLFGFDARGSAKRMRRRGEVTVYVKIDSKINPSLVLIGSSYICSKAEK